MKIEFPDKVYCQNPRCENESIGQAVIGGELFHICGTCYGALEMVTRSLQEAVKVRPILTIFKTVEDQIAEKLDAKAAKADPR